MEKTQILQRAAWKKEKKREGAVDTGERERSRGEDHEFFHSFLLLCLYNGSVRRNAIVIRALMVSAAFEIGDSIIVECKNSTGVFSPAIVCSDVRARSDRSLPSWGLKFCFVFAADDRTTNP